MPLTDLDCKNARVREGRAYERLANGGGVYLEVTPAGPNGWQLMAVRTAAFP